MNRLKGLLGRSLYKIADLLNHYANVLLFKPVSVSQEVVEEEDMSVVDFALRGLPTSFTSFAEGLSSKDYYIRHDAAAKVVSFYVDQKGSPLLNDLIKAARVLLEDTLASEGDISYLVEAWKDQASAPTEELREVAQQREEAIYADLKDREKKLVDAQIKSAQDKLQ